MQKLIRELIMEEDLDISSAEDENNGEEQKEPTKTKRGRKAIPEKWSRVISIFGDDLEKVKSYDLGPELLLDASLDISTSNGRQQQNWKPIFWPPTVKKEQMNFKVSNQVLSEKQLVKYGEQLTRFREKLRKDANSTAQKSKESNEAMMVYIDKLAKKMGRGYFCKPKEKSR